MKESLVITMKNDSQGTSKKVEWILRIGIFGTFFGHGIFALMVKQSWLGYFSPFGISEPTAAMLLPFIGLLDLAVSLIVLFKPINVVLGWAAFWGFATALVRPISGEPVWDFVERWANWAAPLALLYLRGFPRKLKDWFK